MAIRPKRQSHSCANAQPSRSKRKQLGISNVALPHRPGLIIDWNQRAYSDQKDPVQSISALPHKVHLTHRWVHRWQTDFYLKKEDKYAVATNSLVTVSLKMYWYIRVMRCLPKVAPSSR